MGNSLYTKKGRSKGRFILITHVILKSDAWKVCKPPAKAVYIQLLLRFNGKNNGYIPFSCREASEECNISKNTANRSFNELIRSGLIKCITKSNFDCRKKLASEWAFTNLKINGLMPTNEWRDFKKKS